MPKQIVAKMSGAEERTADGPKQAHCRSSETIADIAFLEPLRGKDLIDEFRPNFGDPGFRTDEAIVYFAMRASKEGDNRTLNGLFEILTARCQRFFRGQMKGMRSDDDRMDAQGIVLERLAKNIVEGIENHEFMTRRFRVWLQNKSYTAIAQIEKKRRKEPLFDDMVGVDDNDESRIESVAQHELSVEDAMLMRDALGRLPDDLRQLYILRYYLDWRVGDDRKASPPHDPTLADRYGVSTTVIKKRLAKAEMLLAQYRKDSE